MISDFILKLEEKKKMEENYIDYCYIQFKF